jgi:hypothetical protein
VEVIDVAGATPACSGKKVSVAASIQGHRGHLPAGDDLSHLRARGLDVQCIVDNAHRFADTSDLENRVQRERRIRVEDNVAALIPVESW